MESYAAGMGLNSCSGEPAARGRGVPQESLRPSLGLNSCSGEPAARGARPCPGPSPPVRVSIPVLVNLRLGVPTQQPADWDEVRSQFLFW